MKKTKSIRYICFSCGLQDFFYVQTTNFNGPWKQVTLDSGIDVAPEISVAPGSFGKNIKRSPESRHPPYRKIGNILEKCMHYPL